jgi:uncharacterized protein YpmS
MNIDRIAQLRKQAALLSAGAAKHNTVGAITMTPAELNELLDAYVHDANERGRAFLTNRKDERS